MECIAIETSRLFITQFDRSMIESVHRNSLDEDVRTFVPDEVFETVAQAQDTIEYLIECYKGNSGPFVYPVFLRNNENLGYVQIIPYKNSGWEIGYHIAQYYTGQGYATEAVRAFIPIISQILGLSKLWGLCRADNIASRKVLEKCNFILQGQGTKDYHGELHEVCTYLYCVS